MNETPVKDKMAVIFHGIVGGMSGRNGLGTPINILDCSKTIKYNVLSTYDCDVFIHSWSTEFKEQLDQIYSPVASLYQPQEPFHFTPKEMTDEIISGQAFRCTSGYVSLERAMELKRQYEIENNFRYKWVFVLRFDLIFFNKIDFSLFDENSIHIISEPFWPHNASVISDMMYLCNSTMADELSKMGTELLNGQWLLYQTLDAHHAVYLKLMNLVGENRDLIKVTFERYRDVEAYRLIMQPEMNPAGHAFGELETKGRLEELLKKINDEEGF